MPIIEGFLTPQFRPLFSDIVALSRDAKSEGAKALESRGVKVIEVDYTRKDSEVLKMIFNDVDIFVDTLGNGENGEGMIARETLLKAAISSGNVKVYVPSDFGVDLSKISFEHPFWEAKKKIIAEARSHGLKTIPIRPGLYLEGTFEPWFGYDTPNKKWTVVGPPSTTLTVTSINDVGRAVASITALAFRKPDNVPDVVRLSGQTLTIQEARDIFAESRNADISVESLDAEVFKKEAMARLPFIKMSDSAFAIIDYLKVAIADGAVVNFENENELVNPVEGWWKWTTVQDYAKQ